jgi:hypothetical protein
MTNRTALLAAIPALALGVLSAQAEESYRCTLSSGGAFKPAVVVMVNGERQLHTIGMDGLSRSMLYNNDLLAEWVEARYGIATEVVEIGGCSSAAKPYAGVAMYDDDSGSQTQDVIQASSVPAMEPEPEPQPDLPPDFFPIN